MIDAPQLKSHNPTLFQRITQHKLVDEADIVSDLINQATLDDATKQRIAEHASTYVRVVRQTRIKSGGLDAFMAEYDLSSQEGIALMCLAEALLRIPDNHTADKLIQDKLCDADWQSHLNSDGSLFVNATTWSLMLTGKFLHPGVDTTRQFQASFRQFVGRCSKGAVRTAVRKAMKILGKQFVMGEQIASALKRAKSFEKQGYRYSYDMLGEAAKNEADAQRYYASYEQAIHAIGAVAATHKDVIITPSISIKLTALLARYELAQTTHVLSILFDRVLMLAKLAKQYHMALTIDAEEADRLELSLILFEKLVFHPDLADWDGLGLAVQAYQKRAMFVLDWLVDLAKQSHKRIQTRLVKGAYWDSEVKHAQEAGLDGYPVFTRKVYTDIAYIACIKKLLANTQYLYPQFATHNTHSLATVMVLAGERRDFEFQCLHGMGNTLYDQIVDSKQGPGLPCRIYAPVGEHKHLLAYLVRRLLENGANSSFVNRIIDTTMPIEKLVQDPVEVAQAKAIEPHPQIPLPQNLYGDRMNAKGIDLTDTSVLEKLTEDMQTALRQKWVATPMLAENIDSTTEEVTIFNPADRREKIGSVHMAEAEHVEAALSSAAAAFDRWNATAAEERAQCLEKLADLYEANMPSLMAIAIKEAGKSIANAVDEVREAIDFCRYYAVQTRLHFAHPVDLPGPTGEKNQMYFSGRGVFVCISPWNFPLAIFTGEVTAALAAGNTVIAKPAAQTNLIATAAVELMYQAGFARDVIQLLPGDGKKVGARLTHDDRIAGVIFTGSTETAKLIQTALTQKSGAIATLVAETGGQNCMIVDSSALLEQVVDDVIRSSFDSAGQRCSALRVMFVQADIADSLISMLSGAMDELVVGDPSLLQTDIGPVIDQTAQKGLLDHIAAMQEDAKLIHQVKLPSLCEHGTFVAPTLFEIDHISRLTREVFGPVLHLIRYKNKQMDKVIEQINSTGYGLTFGIHSRIETTVDYVTKRIKAGNLYVNRNMVGAIVGAQPFGGQGLSGTGPKAGGPYYLPRLAVEKVISTDTTASGGNASLMTLEQDD